MDSAKSFEMSGYMPCRGDFDVVGLWFEIQTPILCKGLTVVSIIPLIIAHLSSLLINAMQGTLYRFICRLTVNVWLYLKKTWTKHVLLLLCIWIWIRNNIILGTDSLVRHQLHITLKWLHQELSVLVPLRPWSLHDLLSDRVQCNDGIT